MSPVRTRLWTLGLSAALAGSFALPTLVAAPVPELTEEQLVDKAKKLNAEAKTLEDADAKLKALNKDKLNTPKLVKAAAKMQKAAKGDEKPFRYFATLVLAKAAHNAKDYDSAEVFYRACSDIAIDDLQSSEHIVRAVDGHLEFLLFRKKHDAVIELAERVMAINGDQTLAFFNNFEVAGHLLMARSRKGETKDVLETLDRLIKKSDGLFLYHQMKARILVDAEKYEDAIKEYGSIVESIQDNENIDKELRKQVEHFLNSSARVIKQGMQGLTTQLGVDIGFMFKQQRAFERGVAALKATDPLLAKYLEKSRQTWSERLIKSRIDLEHNNWSLPRVTYDASGAKIVAVQPLVAGQPVTEFIHAMLDRVCCFVEDVTAHCIQRKMAAPITLTEIPVADRRSEAPERFQLTLAVGGQPRWNISYHPSAFEMI